MRARIVFSATVLLTGCTVGYNPETQTCTVGLNPSGELLEAAGEMCREAIQNWRKRKEKPAEVVATPAPVIPAPVEDAIAHTPAVEPPAAVRGKEVCSGDQKAPDGPGGFLWKDGDSSKKIVVLLPGRFTKVDAVYVTRKDNGREEKLTNAGTGNPDTAGPRQHFRGGFPVTKYKGIVRVTTGKTECRYKFRNAARVD